MATAPTRIYIVRLQGMQPQLVRARHPSAAMSHAVAQVGAVAVATQDELVDLVAQGVKVADATAATDQPSLI